MFKTALSKLIGSDSKKNKITKQISNTLCLQIELNDQKKPISLSLINQELLNPKPIKLNECDKSKEEIDYRPLSEQLNVTESSNTDNLNLLNSMNTSNSHQRIEGNYRGLHKFIARHDDEVSIDIGDEIYVIKQEDDLWFKGINLASNVTGYFPSLYVIDCNYNELFQTVNYFGFSDDDSGLNCECSNDDFTADLLDSGRQCYRIQKERFYFQFLGSLEVARNKGNEVLEQCIKKISKAYESKKSLLDSFLCAIEITDFGIRFFSYQNDSIKETENDENNNERKENDKYDESKLNEIRRQENYFFQIQNITFFGFLESNDKTDQKQASSEDSYFAFITQHPKLKTKYAAHVFISYDKQSAKDICEAIGKSFHRYYLNYIELSQNI